MDTAKIFFKVPPQGRGSLNGYCNDVEPPTVPDITKRVKCWSQRSLTNYKKSLWGGWHIKSSKKSIIHTGDTGYSKDFKDIHEKLGDVDVASIPTGSYEPRWFMKHYHVNPEEALLIHQDLQAKLSIAVFTGEHLD